MKVLQADGHLLMVRVDRGEEVTHALCACAAEYQIPCAAVTGLGAVEGVCIAYFDAVRKEYLEHDPDGIFELVALTGNLGLHGGAPFLHAHVVLSGADCRCLGGHLVRATVAVTGEFMVRVGEKPLFRVQNDTLGIKEQQMDGETA